LSISAFVFLECIVYTVAAFFGVINDNNMILSSNPVVNGLTF